MSWTDSDGLERGDVCNACGEPVEEEHHAYCPTCWARHMGWEAGEPDPGIVAQLREEIAELRARMETLEARRAT